MTIHDLPKMLSVPASEAMFPEAWHTINAISVMISGEGKEIKNPYMVIVMNNSLSLNMGSDTKMLRDFGANIIEAAKSIEKRQ